MNVPHLHLVLNHFPFAGLVFGLVVVLVGWARKSEAAARTGLGLLVLGGAFGVASYFSGNAAAAALTPGLAPVKARVDEHAQAGIFGLAATVIAALVAAGALALARKRGTTPRGYALFLIVISLWATAVIARVSYLGALISHPEIRTGSR